MKKKVLSILACASMVLVGGLALTACGGDNTQPVSLEEINKYIERPEVVTEFKGFKGTTKSVVTTEESETTTEGTYSILKSKMGSLRQYKGFSTLSKITRKAKNQQGTTVTTVTESGTSYRDNMVYTYLSTPNQDPTKANVVTKTSLSVKELSSQLKNRLDQIDVVREENADELIGMFTDTEENDYGIEKDVIAYGASITKTEKDGKTSYKFTREEDDRTENTKSNIEITFVYENDAIIEFHMTMKHESDEGKTETTMDMVATDAVEYPTDLASYTDMTQDVVGNTNTKVVDLNTLANATATIEGASEQFTNSGLQFTFEGNRTYKVKGTAHTMTADQAAKYGAPATATGGDVYVVIKLNWQEGYKVTYRQGKTEEWSQEGEHGYTLEIIRRVTKDNLTYTVTVEDAEGVAHTYTFDFTELTNFAPAE